MNYVIFTSSLSLIALGVAVALYILIGVSRALSKDAKVFPAILGVLNMLVHIVIIAICLYLNATAEEMIFIFVLSAALALTVTKQRKGE